MPPLSGIVGIYGPDIVTAAEVAMNEVNQSGGVLGKKLELVIEDDGSLPESSVAAAQKLIAHHECVAIIGNLLSNSRIAVAYRVAEPLKVPYLNFSFYEGSILSRYFFHFAALPNQQIDKMIPYMANVYGDKMFFAGNNYEWPRGSIFAAQKKLGEIGGKSVGEEYLPIGVELAAINQLLDLVELAKPDVFVPYFAGIDQVMLLEQFSKRGLKSKIAVVMGHFDEMIASQLTPEVRSGFYSSNSYFMSINSPANQQYKSLLAQHPKVNGLWPGGNGITTNFGEGAYVCVKAFAKAANLAASTAPEALMERLGDISISAPQGKVDMNPKHQHAEVNNYLTRCNYDGEFEIIDSFGAIAPELPSRYKHQEIGSQANLEDDIRLQSRILEQMQEGVILVNADSHEVVYSNASAQKIFGYDKESATGFCLSRHEYFHSEKYQTYFQFISTLQHKGEHKSIVSCLTTDEQPIFCSLSASTFTHPTYLEVWLIVVADVTEQVNSEEELAAYRLSLETQVEKRTRTLKATELKAKNLAYRLQKIMDTAGEGIITTDEKGVIESINPSAETLFGYHESELIGQNINVLVTAAHEAKHPLYIKNYQNGARSRIMTTGREVKGRHKSGNITDIGISISEMEIDGQKTFTAMCQDISLRKQQEKKLREAVYQAKKASQAKSEFLSSMSHELRTPLNAIMGFSQLLELDSLSEYQAENVDFIYKAGEHLLGLIDDILDLAKIEAGKLVFSIETVTTRHLLDECLSYSSNLAESKKIQIHDRTVKHLPNLKTDFLRAKQAILNLLSNAIKYNTENGSVWLENTPTSDGFLRISIRDTGPGIPEGKHEDVFQAFNRLGAEASEIEGSGIGLSLTKRLIEEMGGNIGFTSSEGNGCEFWIDFPLCEEKQETQKEQLDKQIAKVKELQGHVFYVEDNLTNQKIVASFLKRNGQVGFSSSTSAEEGISLIKDEQPDVVLMDINLPGINGIEALKILKSDNATKHIPVIALSANALPEIIHLGKTEGFEDYLTKPIDLGELSLVLEKALGKPKTIAAC